MKSIRVLVPVIAVVFALLPSAAIASTLTTYHESVFAIETGRPTPCGSNLSLSSFAGIARGTLNGAIQIAVCHTPLDPNVNPSATIVGGAFTLISGAKIVAGGFDNGGTVSLLSSFHTNSVCFEKYTVSGSLLPSGHFDGKLLHYGAWTGTSCNVLFATISGNATLTA